MRLPIERDCSGRWLPESQRATVAARIEGDQLCVDVDAPYFGDPPPPTAAPGVCDQLWEHEVVELFLADDAEHYLEIELGPHGHHLVIELRGVRQKACVGLPITYATEINGARFSGHARMPLSYLTMQVTRANAYAIHGSAEARVYHAHAPTLGDKPDFHRLACFVPCTL